VRITTIRHPEFTDDENDFFKWRLAYKGGRAFIDQYLKMFSKREDKAAFLERRDMSYAPTFAKTAINKLKNTIYSRMGEIKRIGGPVSYQEAVRGEAGGVDCYGSAMSTFIGQDTIEELMIMRRVGIFVDKPQFDGNLLARNQGKHPYLYYYKAEDILSWSWNFVDGEFVYTNVLLRDTDYAYDDKSGLVCGTSTRYRQMWLSGEDGKVHIQFWIPNKDDKAEDDIKDGEEVVLDLQRLPFVIGELSESLMADAADYQVSLTNLASADVNWVFRANFTTYVEQFDPASESPHIRRPIPIAGAAIDPDTGKDPLTGSSAQGQQSSDKRGRDMGALVGLRYPKGLDAPTYIAPPTEPLLASMKKQEQMKEEIFEIIDVAASRAKSTHASAESKEMDNAGIETGLSYIGLELQYMEREIAKIWGMYENQKPAVINYPTNFKLKSDSDRLDEAKAYNEIKSAVPSKTFGKEIAKEMSHTMLEQKRDPEILEKIDAEIDAAAFISGDPELIKTASELGMVDAETGSNALGFDGKKVVPIAKKEHTERLAEIAKSQASAAARGVDDKAPLKGKKESAKAEKTNPDGSKKKVRGDGK
jgi:hypothetical protein